MSRVDKTVNQDHKLENSGIISDAEIIDALF